MGEGNLTTPAEVAAIRSGAVLKTVSPEATLELGHSAAKNLRHPYGDPRIGKEGPVHVGPAHHAHDDLVDGLGEIVVHLVAEQHHLPKDGAGREQAVVRARPSAERRNTRTRPLLRINIGLLVRREQQVTSRVGVYRCDDA